MFGNKKTSTSRSISIGECFSAGTRQNRQCSSKLSIKPKRSLGKKKKKRPISSRNAENADLTQHIIASFGQNPPMVHSYINPYTNHAGSSVNLESPPINFKEKTSKLLKMYREKKAQKLNFSADNTLINSRKQMNSYEKIIFSLNS